VTPDADLGSGGADDHGTFVEYHGSPGATEPCVEAIERLLHSRREIAVCTVLTCRASTNPEHALMLVDALGDRAVVKSGFTSGYGGAGPKGLSATLALLDWHGVWLEEVDVPAGLLSRLDASALTVADMEWLDAAARVRPARLWDYVFDSDDIRSGTGNPWRFRPLTVPLGIMDDRLASVARDFWSDPDGALFRAHRQLEDAVREKAGITGDEGVAGAARIFAAAFNRGGRLHWPGVPEAEQVGRAGLFVGTVAAYRNPRAHRAPPHDADQALRELLLLNHLFRLESEALARAADPDPQPIVGN